MEKSPEKSPEKFCPSCGEDITHTYNGGWYTGEDDSWYYCDACELPVERDEECPAKN